MNDEQWNLAVRKFLKRFGVRAQRELDEARRLARERGGLDEHAKLEVTVQLRCIGLDMEMQLREALEQ